MKRFGQHIIIILYIGLLLTGCRDTLVPPEEVPRAEAERTIIVYMAADNSLSNSVKLDTIEMKQGKDLIPENVNFLIYIDDKKKDSKPAIYELSAKNGMQLWKQFDEEQCSTDPNVMLQILQQIEYYFPARHYGIDLWSHATGWVPEQTGSTRQKTFGKDETNASGKIEMEITALRDVLAHFPKFDYIFFDACFMQCIEVAYELRNVTNYMVGSPAEIPGPGAPYHLIINALCKGDAMGIVRGYDSGYPNGVYEGVLLSLIDCTQLEPLAVETGRLLTPFFMERRENNRTDYQYYCSKLGKFTYYFDMRTTMCRLLSEEDYAAWMELFDKAVPLRTHSSTNRWFSDGLCDHSVIDAPECYGGVSMFIPLDKYDNFGLNEDFQQTSWYQALGWQLTGW